MGDLGYYIRSHCQCFCFFMLNSENVQFLLKSLGPVLPNTKIEVKCKGITRTNISICLAKGNILMLHLFNRELLIAVAYIASCP